MTRHPVRLRPVARREAEAAAHWYLDQGGAVLASRFVENLHAALDHISLHPATGSVRYGTLTGYPGLRFWPVKGFPYLVFYRDAGDWLDVWRVLHAERDIPAWLREDQ